MQSGVQSKQTQSSEGIKWRKCHACQLAGRSEGPTRLVWVEAEGATVC